MDKTQTALNISGVVAKHLGKSAALATAQTAGIWTGFAAVALVTAPLLKKQDERRKAKTAQPES
jgi:hypothetical protein